MHKIFAILMTSVSGRHCFGVAKLQDVIAKTELRMITRYAFFNFFFFNFLKWRWAFMCSFLSSLAGNTAAGDSRMEECGLYY